MVVVVGETEADVLRVAPIVGETITYEAPETCQLRVTAVPAVTEVADAVKLEIVGVGPVGTFELV